MYTLTSNPTTDPDALELAKELDGLPLALATAGSYLDQVPAVRVSDYLRLYKESWLQLLESSPEVSSYEDRMLYSTWQLSYDHVKRQNELSAKLLCFWAYFDSQDLWLELLLHVDSDSPDWLHQLTKDEISFHEAIRVLVNHGLVEAHTSPLKLIESQGYSMHLCVHSWTIHILNKPWNYNLATLAVGFVASHIHRINGAWVTEQRIIQHATRCSYMLLKSLAIVVEDNTNAWACYNLGVLFDNQGKLLEAEHMYQRTLQGYEKAYGPDHIETLDTLNNLGILYKDQGKLVLAEQIYQRALQGYEKAYGPDHINTLDTINNLGVLYDSQGKLLEAEQMYQRALQGYKKAYGPDHIETLDTLNNLGVLYDSQGKLLEAEHMYQRALQGYEKAYGPDYTNALNTINNLGVLYDSQGKLFEAEHMYQRALQGYEKAYGPDHTNTLNTINNLGVLYGSQGKLLEAEHMYQRVLQGYESAVGIEDVATFPQAVNTMFNLGLLFQNQGDLEKAKIYISKALFGCEKIYGPDHSESQEVRDILRDLDSQTERQARGKVDMLLSSL